MNEDIKELFREKNKDILVNNLKYDLDKNINSLIDTVNNIYDLEFDTAYKNIIGICTQSNLNNISKYLKNKLDEVKKNSYDNLISLINNKKNMLIDIINNTNFTKDEMTYYYELINDSTLNIKDKLDKDNYIYKIKDDICTYIKSILNDDLVINRIDDYIINRLNGKLINKVNMEIVLRDNNLINKGKVAYIRYQEIMSKTELNNIEY